MAVSEQSENSRSYHFTCVVYTDIQWNPLTVIVYHLEDDINPCWWSIVDDETAASWRGCTRSLPTCLLQRSRWRKCPSISSCQSTSTALIMRFIPSFSQKLVMACCLKRYHHMFITSNVGLLIVTMYEIYTSCFIQVNSFENDVINQHEFCVSPGGRWCFLPSNDQEILS